MTTKNIPRVSFTVMEKQMTQMLCFKVKTTPNKTTVRKMLQALFLQHFNGFILHGTFVVCQVIYIIFSKIKFFPLEYCYCFVVTASALPETASIYGWKLQQRKYFFVFFYKVRTNCDPTKPYNKSLINLVCSVCTGNYCLRFLSHRPRSFVARSVRKPQAILSRTDLELG